MNKKAEHEMEATIIHLKSDGPCQCGNCKEYGGDHVYSFKFEDMINYKDPNQLINIFCMKQPRDGKRVKITIIVEEM